MQWMKSHKILAILIVLIIVASLGITIHQITTKEEGKYTEPIKRGDIVEGVYGIGTVKANQSYDLQTGFTSSIQKSFVQEGDRVKKDDPLVKLDQLMVNAPFDGVVTYYPYKVGELVTLQNKVLTLTDLKDRYLIVSLEQEGAISVRKGQKAKLSFESYRDTTYEGTVQSVYSQEEEFLARISIAELPEQILPGMTADVAIGIDEHKDVLLVPVAAIESAHVYVKSKLKTKKIPIKVGIIDGFMAEIVEGDLKEGDRLLIRDEVEP